MWLQKTDLHRKLSTKDQLEATALVFRLLRKHVIHIAALGSATSKEAKMLIVADIADVYLNDQQSRDDVARIIELVATDIDLKEVNSTAKTIHRVWVRILEPCVQYLYRLGAISQIDVANLAWVKANWGDTWQQKVNR